jgi:hypothetical protein
MAANGRPSDAAFARAGVLIKAAMYDLAVKRLEAAESVSTASHPTHKPHNSPQTVQIEEIETDPKPA